MSDLLVWQPARYEHRQQLQTFLCAAPAKVAAHKWVGHEASWELKAQGGLRNARPPMTDPDVELWVGEDFDGLGAAVMFAETPGSSEPTFKIQSVGLALRLRGATPGEASPYAKEILGVVFGRVRARTQIHNATEAFIVAQIDPKNRGSQRLFAAMGFACYDSSGELHKWGRQLPVV